MIKKNSNKYFKWYWSICENAKCREIPEGYTERHHIYPKSIYGENKDLVSLTAKEHRLVHLLLWWGLREEYGKSDERTRKMACAYTMMNRIGKTKRKIQNGNEYSFLRIAYSEINKGRKMSIESRKKMSESQRKYYKKYPKTEEDKQNHSLKMREFYQNNPEAKDNQRIFMINNNPMNNKKHTDNTKQKIRESHKGTKHNLKTKEKMSISKRKIVYQYDLEGNFINEYESARIASKINKLCSSNISDCCRNKRKTVGGYIWRYEKFI